MHEADTQMLERAVQLSMDSARALDDLSTHMTTKDESILTELRTLSTSFKTLASEDCDFYSMFQARQQSGHPPRTENQDVSSKQGTLGGSSTRTVDTPSIPQASDETYTSAGFSSMPPTLEQNEVRGYRSGGPSSSPSVEGSAAATATLPKQEIEAATSFPVREEREEAPELVWSLSDQSSQQQAPAHPEERGADSLVLAAPKEPTVQQRTDATIQVIEVMGGDLVTSLERRLSLLNELNDGFKELSERYEPNSPPPAS
jgi:hypothetical protein